MRSDTGKLPLPDRSSTGTSTTRRRVRDHQQGGAGLYFYPKGQEPSLPHPLCPHSAAIGTMDIRPNTVSMKVSRSCVKPRIESFQAHMHLRGKAMKAFSAHQPGRNRSSARRSAEGDDSQDHGVARQHDGEEEQPGSEPVGRLGRSHGGRNGPRVDQLRLHEGRRLQDRAGQAACGADRDHAAATAAGPAVVSWTAG